MNHNFCIKDFEGPLDLLLHLVRVSQMDIYDINIVEITKQYVDFINQANDLSVDDLSEYLVMASELIHLKSKMLINANEDDEADEEYIFANKEELQNRLLEYEKLKELTENFKSLEDKRSNFYTKEISDLKEYEKLTTLDSSLELDELINAFQLFLERQKLSKPLNTKITKKEYSVKRRIGEIKTILKKRGRCTFTSLFDEMTKPFVIVTFLSVLELSKNNEIKIIQDHNFEDIIIEMK